MRVDGGQLRGRAHEVRLQVQASEWVVDLPNGERQSCFKHHSLNKQQLNIAILRDPRARCVSHHAYTSKVAGRETTNVMNVNDLAHCVKGGQRQGYPAQTEATATAATAASASAIATSATGSTTQSTMLPPVSCLSLSRSLSQMPTTCGTCTLTHWKKSSPKI